MNEDISLALPYRSQTAIGDAHYNGHPASCKCNCTTDDNPSITMTMQSGTIISAGEDAVIHIWDSEVCGLKLIELHIYRQWRQVG